MEKLICIYTCEKDKKSLCNFKQTNLYKELQNDKNTKILEVYAGSNKTQLLENKLLLDCEEDYARLSIKTYKMISECVKSINFDVLIKIDCNIFEYKNKNFGFNKKIKKDLFNEKCVTAMIFSDKIQSDYFGSGLTFLRSFDSLSKWSTYKKVKLKCKKSSINFGKPYYTGKFYMCDKNFCEYISHYGKNKAIYFAENLGGIEDLYIGELYAKYNREHLDIVLVYLSNALEQKKYAKTTMIYLYRLYKEFKEKYKKYILENENCLNSDFFDFKKFKAKKELNDKKINYIETKLGVI